MKQLLVLTALPFVLFACGNTGTEEATEVFTPVTPVADTVAHTGVVIDAAMNSVFIKTTAGDTLSFGYPELDRAKIQSFMLNDTITVSTVADTVVTITNKTQK